MLIGGGGVCRKTLRLVAEYAYYLGHSLPPGMPRRKSAVLEHRTARPSAETQRLSNARRDRQRRSPAVSLVSRC